MSQEAHLHQSVAPIIAALPTRRKTRGNARVQHRTASATLGSASEWQGWFQRRRRKKKKKKTFHHKTLYKLFRNNPKPYSHTHAPEPVREEQQEPFDLPFAKPRGDNADRYQSAQDPDGGAFHLPRLQPHHKVIAVAWLHEQRLIGCRCSIWWKPGRHNVSPSLLLAPNSPQPGLPHCR